MKTSTECGRWRWWLAAMFTAAGCWGGEPALRTRGPYLQRGTPSSMTIVWRTRGEVTPVVQYGTSLDALDRTVAGDAITLRVSRDQLLPPSVPRLHSAPLATFQYEARLSELLPDTTYYYAVHDGDRLLAGGDAGHTFRTAPRRGEPTRVRCWVLGDSGTGGEQARSVYASVRAFTEEQDWPFDLFLHLGDMAYDTGTDAEFQGRFFDLYQPTLAHTVCWPAPGNHEEYASVSRRAEGPYYDAFVLPGAGEAGGVRSGTEAYYSFDHGNVHFVSLCTSGVDRSPEGSMAAWLKRDLAATRAEWLVAFWHISPYTKGSHDSDVEENAIEIRSGLVPLLEEAGVDLVLTGHSHIYERSMLVDGAYATPTRGEGVVLDDGDGDPEGEGPYRKSEGLHPHEGAVYVVSGHGGATMRRGGTMPIMLRTLREFGSAFVEVDGNTLSGFMLNADGEVRDRFALVKEGKVRAEHLAHPWLQGGPRIRPRVPLFLDRVEVAIDAPGAAPGYEVYYTLDGTPPTRRSPRYGQPIVLTNSATVSALIARPGRTRTSTISASHYVHYEGGSKIPALPLASEASLEAGVAYRYYEGEWNALPDFSTEPVVAEGTLDAVSLLPRARDDHFGFVFDGYLRVPAQGAYGFFLTSDDGSRLEIGGTTVVDHDGRHAASEKAGYVVLDAGFHAFRLAFFEAGGDEALSLSWAGPGMEPRVVERGTLWRKSGRASSSWPPAVGAVAGGTPSVRVRSASPRPRPRSAPSSRAGAVSSVRR